MCRRMGNEDNTLIVTTQREMLLRSWTCIVLAFSLIWAMQASGYRQAQVETINLKELQNTALAVLVTAQQRLLAQLNEANDLFAQSQQTLQLAKEDAAETTVSGEGISVTLSDAGNGFILGRNASLYLVHDEDILRLVSLVRAAGAKAIAVSGVRIGADTFRRCGGPVIFVAGEALTPPYKIQAIGNKDELCDAVLQQQQIFTAFGMACRVEKEEHLTINGMQRKPFGAP